MSEPTAADLGGLAALLQERIGLHLRPEGLGSLRIAWLARFEDPQPPPVPPRDYLALLRSPGGDEELRRLLPLVTVGKTHFFRDEAQFGALAALLPGLLRAARDQDRPLAFWSAGCATGEEPYSLAMLATELGAEPSEVDIWATDLNPATVEAAVTSLSTCLPVSSAATASSAWKGMGVPRKTRSMSRAMKSS